MRTLFCMILALFSVACLHPLARAEGQPLQVEQFLREAKAGGEASMVIGVACKADPAGKRFGLMDTRKFGCCDKPENCVAGVLPVKWEGTMPAEKATVRVRGTVVEEGGKLLFAASEVKVLEEAPK
jgi:hypothetical protein